MTRILAANANDNEALIYRGQIQTPQRTPERRRPDPAKRAEERSRQRRRSLPPWAWLSIRWAIPSVLSKNGAPPCACVLISSKPSAPWPPPPSASATWTRSSRRPPQIIKLQPASPDGYAMRALSKINRKQFAAAEQDVNKAIEVAPQSAVGYIQLGNLKLVQKQYGDAEQSLPAGTRPRSQLQRRAQRPDEHLSRAEPDRQSDRRRERADRQGAEQQRLLRSAGHRAVQQQERFRRRRGRVHKIRSARQEQFRRPAQARPGRRSPRVQPTRPSPLISRRFRTILTRPCSTS